MLNLMKQSIFLNIAYFTNTLIYRLKQLPIIKKIVPKNLYGNDGLQSLFQVFAILARVLILFLKKFLYALLLIVVPMMAMNTMSPSVMLTIFFFLTMIGGISNNEMVTGSKEKYYSVVLMRVDSKKYALCSFFFDLIEQFIGFLPIFLISIFAYHVPIYVFPFLFILLGSIKLIGAHISLIYFQKKKKFLLNNMWILIPFYLIAFTLAYFLPYSNIVISPILFLLITTIIGLCSIFSYRYLMRTDVYYPLYKNMLTLNRIFFQAETNSKNVQMEQYQKKIELGKQVESKKKGYVYFNELFIRRHYSILMKSSMIFALVYFGIFLVVLVCVLIIPEASQRINRMLMVFLPYFVFIMYFTNRGAVITQAMFVNCDHSMLAYRFYRKGNVILRLFKERLKTLIKINLPPTLVIAIGLPILLYASGGTKQPLDYFLLFISIIAMCVFFSVHYLVMYYLLQPYDINMESKSAMYSIVSGATYLVSYYCIQLKAPTTIFAIFVIGFAIVYACTSLYLVYRHAPKTFHLK